MKPKPGLRAIYAIQPDSGLGLFSSSWAHMGQCRQ